MYSRYEQLKTEKGVSDYEVAKATGVAPSTLSAWKKGDYKPKVDKLLLIARYFGVSVETFIEG